MTNPTRIDGRVVYSLTVDDGADTAVCLASALRRLVSVLDGAAVLCECGSTAVATVDRTGRKLPSPSVACLNCGRTWADEHDRADVASLWRRRAALSSAVARAALPRAVRRGESVTPGATDFASWARLGIADAVLGRAPAHLPDPDRPWATAYAGGWTAAMTAATMTESTTMTTTTTPQPTTSTQPPTQTIDVGGLTMSIPCDQIADALGKAQAEFAEVRKDNKVDVKNKDGGKGYSYVYADLASVLEAIRPALAKYGLALVQSPVTRGQTVEVSTTLLHRSGQWIACKPIAIPASGNAQAIGSAITYARRYQAQAVVGLAPVDDDGAEATASSPGWDRQREQPQSRRPPQPKANDKLERLRAAVDEKVGVYADASDMRKGAAWAEVLARAKLDVSAEGGPWGHGFDVLGRANTVLNSLIKEIEGPDSDAGDVGGAPY